MKFKCFWLLILLFTTPFFGQYTDQINSNRPGASMGAFAVGKNVIQTETGIAFRRYVHNGYNQSNFEGRVHFLSLRWGFLTETIELLYEGSFMTGTLESKVVTVPTLLKQRGFLQNFIGVKYLLYDPFKKEREINVYSWKANNGFKIRDLIPAVSLTVGTNINPLNNNPFAYRNIFSNLYRPIFYQNIYAPLDQEPFFDLRGTLATQSHFLGTWVFVTNFNYDRILSDYPELSYIVTLTHTLNPLWSVYMEQQGRYSSLFKDNLVRLGVAYLFSNNLQLEATLGSSFKNTPHILLANAGVSYRLDFHKDFVSGAEALEKEQKKEERGLKKSFRKNSKGERKRNRKARRN